MKRIEGLEEEEERLGEEEERLERWEEVKNEIHKII